MHPIYIALVRRGWDLNPAFLVSTTNALHRHPGAYVIVDYYATAIDCLMTKLATLFNLLYF